MWMLGIEPKSLGGKASVLHCWAIFPDLPPLSLFWEEECTKHILQQPDGYFQKVKTVNLCNLEIPLFFPKPVWWGFVCFVIFNCRAFCCPLKPSLLLPLSSPPFLFSPLSPLLLSLSSTFSSPFPECASHWVLVRTLISDLSSVHSLPALSAPQVHWSVLVSVFHREPSPKPLVLQSFPFSKS